MTQNGFWTESCVTSWLTGDGLVGETGTGDGTHRKPDPDTGLTHSNTQ